MLWQHQHRTKWHRWRPVQHPAQKVRSGTTSAAMADPLTRQFNPALISQYACVYRALPFTPIYVLCPLLVSKCSHPRTPHLDEISQANPWKSRRGCHPLLSHAVGPNSSSWEIANSKNVTCNTTAITRPVSLTSNWSISGSRNSKQCGQAQDLIEKQAI